MSGLPTYAYMPPFQDVTQCDMGVSPETRATLFAGGTFFRSIGLSYPANSIQISIAANAGNWILTVVQTLTSVTETYTTPVSVIVPPITPPDGGTPPAPVPDPAYDLFRAQLLAQSTLITMPVRGFDIRDAGGIDDVEMTAFIAINMTGGSGLPNGPELGFYTGPYRSMWRTSLSERNSPDGELLQDHITYEWDGVEWTPYTPFGE